MELLLLAYNKSKGSCWKELLPNWYFRIWSTLSINLNFKVIKSCFSLGSVWAPGFTWPQRPALFFAYKGLLCYFFLHGYLLSVTLILFRKKQQPCCIHGNRFWVCVHRIRAVCKCGLCDTPTGLADFSSRKEITSRKLNRSMPCARKLLRFVPCNRSSKAAVLHSPF